MKILEKEWKSKISTKITPEVEESVFKLGDLGISSNASLVLLWIANFNEMADKLTAEEIIKILVYWWNEMFQMFKSYINSIEDLDRLLYIFDNISIKWVPGLVIKRIGKLPIDKVILQQIVTRINPKNQCIYSILTAFLDTVWPDLLAEEDDFDKLNSYRISWIKELTSKFGKMIKKRMRELVSLQNDLDILLDWQKKAEDMWVTARINLICPELVERENDFDVLLRWYNKASKLHFTFRNIVEYKVETIWKPLVENCDDVNWLKQRKTSGVIWEMISAKIRRLESSIPDVIVELKKNVIWGNPVNKATELADVLWWSQQGED